jgi:hypothetical protein
LTDRDAISDLIGFIVSGFTISAAYRELTSWVVNSNVSKNCPEVTRSRRSWLGETDIHAEQLARAMAVDHDGITTTKTMRPASRTEVALLPQRREYRCGLIDSGAICPEPVSIRSASHFSAFYRKLVTPRMVGQERQLGGSGASRAHGKLQQTAIFGARSEW